MKKINAPFTSQKTLNIYSKYEKFINKILPSLASKEGEKMADEFDFEEDITDEDEIIDELELGDE